MRLKKDMKLDAEKLKKFRESKAWSQAHLSEVSGISLRTIQRIEKTGSASPETVRSLSGTFGINVRDLTVNNDSPTHEQHVLFDSIRLRITRLDRKAATVAFIISFAISFYMVKFGF